MVLKYLLIFTFLVPTFAFGYDISVVKEKMIPAAEVLRGFTETCDGCNISVFNIEDNKNVAGKLINSLPDCIFTIGRKALESVLSIEKVPIVYSMIMPDASSSKSHISRTSGVSLLIEPYVYLDSFNLLFPERKKIGMVYDPAYSEAFVKNFKATARLKHYEVIAIPINDFEEVPLKVKEVMKQSDIFLLLPEPTVLNSDTFSLIIKDSFEQKVAVFAFAKRYVKMGAVAGLDIIPHNIGEEAGIITNNILSGKKKQEKINLKKAILMLNPKTAEKLGISISKSGLNKAVTVE